MDVRATQRATLEKFLDRGDKVGAGAPWRVLVVDDAGEHIVSTLMSAAALREHHVTMTVRLDDERAEYNTAHALYVLAPTPNNARAVVRDVDGTGSGRRARARRYAGASVAFTSRATKDVLELLAQCRLPARIHSVVDLYTDFVCPETRLFALRANAGVSYTALRARDAAAVDAAADALHCVAASLGAVPVIRAERGGAAELVARALNARLAADLGRFRRPSSFRRPLLLLLDRDHDFAPVLHHSWAYQALVHDCLELVRNEVVFSTRVEGATDAPPKRKTMRHRLDKSDDEFWQSNSELPFPQVAEAIEEALTTYRADVDAINRRAGRAANGLPDDADDDDAVAGASGNLAQAMQSLPELAQRKERLDIHTNIGTALVEAIDERKLDVYYEFETGVLDEAVRAGSGLLRAHAELHLHALRQLLSGGAGTVADRTRAACLFYGTMGAVMDPELVSELKDAMLDAGVAPDILKCVRVARGFDHRTVEDVQPTKEVPDESVWSRPSLRGMMKHVVKKGYSGITAVAQVATTMMTAKAASFRTTRTALLFLDAAARERTPEEEVVAALERFIYLDPKVSDEHVGAADADEDDEVRRDARKRRCGAIYEDAVVFVCGGGSYVEMASILDGARQADGAPRVLYGCTQLLKGDELVDEMRKSLGGDETTK